MLAILKDKSLEINFDFPMYVGKERNVTSALSAFQISNRQISLSSRKKCVCMYIYIYIPSCTLLSVLLTSSTP